jgi:hypothetical protein
MIIAVKNSPGTVLFSRMAEEKNQECKTLYRWMKQVEKRLRRRMGNANCSFESGGGGFF